MQLQELIDTLTALLPVAGVAAQTSVRHAELRATVDINYPHDPYMNYRDRKIERVRSFFVMIENERYDAQPGQSLAGGYALETEAKG